MTDSAVFVWKDRALFIGDRSQTRLHAHHGVEVSVALFGSLRVRAHDGGWVECAGAAVASDLRHEIDIRAEKVAILYLEPLCADGRAVAQLAQRPRAIDASQAAEVVREMVALLDSPKLDAARVACDGLLRAAGVESSAPVDVDERVARALAYVAGALDEKIQIDQVARAVGLSSSRLTHLFRQSVGVSLGRYVAWLRLRVALTSAMSGMSMTDAAHAAGFADAPHFTRTCQKTFGLAPSEFAPVDVLVVEPGVGHGALPFPKNDRLVQAGPPRAP